MSMKMDIANSKLFNCMFMQEMGFLAISRVATAEMAIPSTGAPFQNLDPNGSSVTVLLPTEASFKNKMMVIRNAADADGELLTVEEDSSTTMIVQLNRGESATLFCDGTSWFVFAQGGGAIGLARTVRVPLVAVTGTTAGGILTWANPTGASIIVTRFMIDITTGSTGAATGDFGIATSVASADTLLDGYNMQTTGVADNIENQGTNGVSARKMTSTSYITGTASATVAGLVGNAYITYIPA